MRTKGEDEDNYFDLLVSRYEGHVIQLKGIFLKSRIQPFVWSLYSKSVNGKFLLCTGNSSVSDVVWFSMKVNPKLL